MPRTSGPSGSLGPLHQPGGAIPPGRRSRRTREGAPHAGPSTRGGRSPFPSAGRSTPGRAQDDHATHQPAPRRDQYASRRWRQSGTRDLLPILGPVGGLTLSNLGTLMGNVGRPRGGIGHQLPQRLLATARSQQSGSGGQLILIHFNCDGRGHQNLPVAASRSQITCRLTRRAMTERAASSPHYGWNAHRRRRGSSKPNARQPVAPSAPERHAFRVNIGISAGQVSGHLAARPFCPLGGIRCALRIPDAAGPYLGIRATVAVHRSRPPWPEGARGVAGRGSGRRRQGYKCLARHRMQAAF